MNITVDAIDYKVTFDAYPGRDRIAIVGPDGFDAAVAYLWHDMEQGEVIYMEGGCESQHIYMPSDLFFEGDTVAIAEWMAGTHPAAYA
jgi:hypothetical protein